MKRAATPLLVVLFAATLHAQPIISLGPEVAVTGPFARPTRTAFEEWKAPAFAAAGREGDYLLAWSEYDAARKQASLVTAKINDNGAIVDGTRNVAPPLRPFDPDAQFPAVAFDGERFLVVWIEGAGAALVGMRFDRDGKPLDPVPFMISLRAIHTWVAVTATNDEFVVTYAVSTFNSTAAALARVGRDGTVLHRDHTLIGIAGAGFWRDIESNGSSVFLVRDSSVYHPFCVIGPYCPGYTNRALTSMPAGQLGVSLPITDTTTSPVPIGSGVATDGSRYLVVSYVSNTGGVQVGSVLRGQLTDADGSRIVREFAVARDVQLRLGSLQGARIDATWTGTSWAVAYEVFGFGINDEKIDVRLTFLSRIGAPLTDPIDIATSAEQERTPVLLVLGESRVLVLYERGTPENPRIVARAVSMGFKTRAIR